MAEKVLPSSVKIRETLLALPETEVKIKIGRGGWPSSFDGKKAKMGFLYQYLVAGRVGEVFGKYAPQAKHCLEFRVDGERAVLFVVKTGKKNTKRGWLLRPALIPINPKYEPLSQPIRDFILNSKDEYPFLLAENAKTSTRYAEAYMKQIFEGSYWNFIDYVRPASAHPSLGYTYDFWNRKRKMITEEEFRAYGAKAKYEPVAGWVPISVRVERRWKEFTSIVLRKVRLRDLEQYYELDSKELELYAGWNSKVAQVARHYIDLGELELDVDEDPTLPYRLTKRARPYFKKLLIQISNVLNPLEAEFDGIEKL